MKVTNVKFYKSNLLRSNHNNIWLRLCSVHLDCGIAIHDITLVRIKDTNELTIYMPRRRDKGYLTGEVRRYPIVYVDDEIYKIIKQAILDQWQRYTDKWEQGE